MIYLKAKPLNNKKIGNVLVLDEFNDSKTKTRKCKCKCLKCNEEFIYTKQTLLKYKHHPHCSKAIYDPSKAIGKRYREWEVLEFHHKDKTGAIYYKCRCSCGNIEIVSIKTIRKGIGHCLNKLHNEKYNIIGNRYGKLVVLKEVEPTKLLQRQFLCRCDCGKEKVILGSNLLYEETTSCGCNKGYFEGTKIDMIKREEAYPNSKSGIKGVWQDKKGYWHSIITVCGKRISFYGGPGEEGKEKSIKWRKEMVEKYHKPLIEKYSKL